ncbi:MAG TPA: ParB/RepB/Spo0J family partition protein [Ktedonobacteraceae bacterium]|nr:ParB/RepB/Spo0J family partition protein [Ktedonobacteraceae bacterium]
MTQREKKADAFKQRRAPAPIDPAAALRQHGVHGDREGQVPGFASRKLITVPIERIRAGKFQKREHIDDEKYQQLKDQIEELGFNFVAILFQDPEDSNFYNPAMGGHIRIKAATELGLTEVQAIIREYDKKALVKGTYMENMGRQPITLVEEGLIFLECQDDPELQWTQEEIAKFLIVPGGRSHVALALDAARAAPDLREMLRKDPQRGRRALYYFKQLDVLGEERAMELRAPHIENFLLGKISTDEVRLIMLQLLAKERGETQEDLSLEQARREHRATSTLASFQRFEKAIGNGTPNQRERDTLESLRAKIDTILERQ